MRAVFDLHGDDLLWQELTAANPGPLPMMAVEVSSRQILSVTRPGANPPHHLFGTAIQLYSPGGNRAIRRIGRPDPRQRGSSRFGRRLIADTPTSVSSPRARKQYRRPGAADALDMFTPAALSGFAGEVQIAVHHLRPSPQKSPRSEITEIYGEAQALSQCREWLSRECRPV